MYAAALAGMAVPPIFGAVILSLSVLQYDFMRGLGWHPLYAVRLDWPSGLALGPLGGVMVAGFVLCGAALALFAVGIGRMFGVWGSRLIFGSGIAMALMAFLTDPTLDGAGRSWHGWIHDLAFLAFGLLLLAGLFTLGFGLRRRAGWGGFSRYTLVTAVAAAALFPLPGVAFYAFMSVLFAWFAVAGWRLKAEYCQS